MKSVKSLAGRGGRLFVVIAFTAAVLAPSLVPTTDVEALLHTNRRLTMASTQPGNVSTDAHGAAVTAGQPGNGAQTRHTFNYTGATSGATVGAIALQYCTTPLGDCVAPTGIDVSTVTAGHTVTGYNGTWNINTSVNATDASGTGYFANDDNGCSGTGVGRTNCILLSTAAAPTATAGTPAITLAFGAGATWIKNPEAIGVFYVRILTFSDQAFTTLVDEGSVAGSVNEDIEILAKVQEKLNFSVSSNTNAPGGTCAALPASTLISLGLNGVLDNNTVASDHSYFRISTNATGTPGTAVQYAGDTLKTASGTSIAQAGGTATTAPAGTERFGLTLDSGDTQAGNGYSLSVLARQANYNSDTAWAFNSASLTSPITIAQTTAGSTITCETGSVEYVANISTTTRPGSYRTNVMYFAVPTF